VRNILFALLAIVVPCHAANFSWNQSNNGFVSSTGVLSVAFTSNNTAGNVIVVSESTGCNSTVPGPMNDSAGNTYVNAFNTGHFAMFYALNINGGANTVTTTASGCGNGSMMIIQEFNSTLAAATQMGLGALNTAGGGGANAVSNGSFTTTGEAMAVMACYDDNTNASSASLTTGTVDRLAHLTPYGSSSAAGYEDLVSVPSYSNTWSISGGCNKSGVVFIYGSANTTANQSVIMVQ
jgi:hypothetical protein